ncbi:hypothetical protein [Chryseobacterium vrystaatense]|uniref:Uncharacterized protein n=1 Tax=Chryseobacterium vrystaatense TaxID=307480 RepID=A0A1M5LTB4_9FLAO|nr:hypothetical protein [Chryseobacterium vrystaatense]SHG67603.1 hypothetical protein SAMN02787073_4631 [Chryseobacterium vrystaatense]
MMTETQEKEVADYLIFQQLPLDILLEIKDHMISQISDIQTNENLNFEQAFLKVKKAWDGEFKMVSYILFSPVQLPLIAKKVIKEKYNSLLKKSVVIGLLFFGINLLLIMFSKNQEEYRIFFRVLNGMFLLALGLAWLVNVKIWKYMRTDFKYKGKCFYTMYQKNTGLMLISTLSMLQLMGKNGHYAYQFFRTQDTPEIFGVLITLFIPFILQTAVIFTLFNFFEHKKSLKKLQNFLQTSTL